MSLKDWFQYKNIIFSLEFYIEGYVSIYVQMSVLLGKECYIYIEGELWLVDDTGHISQ